MSDFWKDYEPEPSMTAPVQEPVAWRKFNGFRFDYIEHQPALSGMVSKEWKPLYDTTPPAQPAPMQGPLAFNCSAGCGACGVKLQDFVTHQTQAHEGDEWVVIATQPQIVSTCCGSPVDVWDERKQDITASVDATPPAQPVASLNEVDVLMMAEAHGIDPGTKGLYGFYIDCISNQPTAQPAPVQDGGVGGCVMCGAAYEDQVIKAPVQEPDAYMYASIAGPVVLHRMKPMGVATTWCVQAQLENDIKVSKMYPLAHSVTPLYTTPPAAAVPDAIIEAGESPDYRDGWNDCRQAMLEMMK
jgi:hypothetical protein